MEILELTIEFDYNQQKQQIYPSLIILNKELTLVDTGYVNFLPLFEKEITKNGYDPKDLKNIIITHYDDDHIGSLFDFKAKYPWVNIIASAVESKFISGETKSERLVQAEQLLTEMPMNEKQFRERFIQQLQNLQHVPVNQKVQDGDKILDGKCTIIATPGHTSGHISIYVPSLNSVITGDAAVSEKQKLVVANPNFCLDIQKANESLSKLQNLKARNYFCYHGGKLTLGSS